MGAGQGASARGGRYESCQIMGCDSRASSQGESHPLSACVQGRRKRAYTGQDIATQAGSNLTAIASDEPNGNVFVAGFGDGVVRLFDKRMDDASNVVMRVWRQHHTWIQSVHLQRGGQRELITGRWVPDSPCRLLSLYKELDGLRPRRVMAYKMIA